jgi:hypothetical protein
MFAQHFSNMNGGRVAVAITDFGAGIHAAIRGVYHEPDDNRPHPLAAAKAISSLGRSGRAVWSRFPQIMAGMPAVDFIEWDCGMTRVRYAQSLLVCDIFSSVIVCR